MVELGTVPLINGCSFTSACKTVIAQGIGTLLKTNGINAYPNPATNIVMLSGLSGRDRISLIDVHGRTLQTITSEGASAKMNVSAFPAGTYLIRIYSAQGDFRGATTISKQ